MRKLFLILVLGSLLAVGSDTYAGQKSQMLFGKSYLPVSRERTDQAFSDLAKLRRDYYRRHYDAKSGMLANELMDFHSRDASASPLTPEISDSFEEFIKIYPKISAGSQRMIAGTALDAAYHLRNSSGFPQYDPDRRKEAEAPANSMVHREAMGNRLTKVVLDAGLIDNWILSPYLVTALQRLVNDPVYGDAASSILTKHPVKMDNEFESLLAFTENLAQSKNKESHTKKLDKREIEPPTSWEKTYKAAVTAPDGSLKEKTLSGPLLTRWVITFPKNEAAELSQSLQDLAKSYPKLSVSSKEYFSARVLKVSSELVHTNVGASAENLYWEAFNSIDITWLEDNDISTSMHLRFGGTNPNNLLKDEKVYLKIMEIEDEHYGGIPSNDNLHWILGDLYDKMGRYEESRKQYLIAKNVSERLVSTGIIPANRFMERNWNVRQPDYVSPYTVERPLTQLEDPLDSMPSSISH